MTHKQLSSFLVLVTTLAAPLGARALDAQIVRYGSTMIGQVGNAQYMATEPWDGSPCFWTSLAGSGGLGSTLFVRGTNEPDWINFAWAGLQFCGSTWYPLVRNGNRVIIFGGPGNDSIAGGPVLGTGIFGEAGNDYIVIAPNDYGYGQTGNDTIYGKDRVNDYFLGGDGNDLFCEHPATVCDVMSGDGGTDKHCGSARNFSGMEGPNCAACGY